MGFQAGPLSPEVQAMKEKLKAQLLHLRDLLEEQSDPHAASACIQEIDRIEREILAIATPGPSSASHSDVAPEQGCDPWISVSF